MKNKIIKFTLLAVVSLSMILSACGQNITSAQTGINISFSWWGNDNRHAYTMDGVDLFNKNKDNIYVNCRYGEWSGYERKNRVWMQSKTEADVMQINYAWLSDFSKNGDGYYDLDTMTDYIDLSGYDESDLEYGRMNGKLNAIPIAFNASTLCHNKDIYDKYGLECPDSWEELFDAAKVLSKDGIYPIGMAKKHLLLMLIAYYEQTTGKNVFDENGNFLLDESGVAIILDFYKELIDKKVLMPIDQFERSKFATGEVASCIFWISDADNYCNALKEKGATPYFTNYFHDENEKLSGVYMKPATMYAISNISENPNEAAMFIDYLLNDREMILLQGTEKGVPANKKAVDILKENGQLDTFGYLAYEKMQENKDILNVMIPIMESENILNAFKKDADAYIYGVEDRNAVTKQIYEDLMKEVNDN